MIKNDICLFIAGNHYSTATIDHVLNEAEKYQVRKIYLSDMDYLIRCPNGACDYYWPSSVADPIAKKYAGCTCCRFRYVCEDEVKLVLPTSFRSKMPDEFKNKYY